MKLIEPKKCGSCAFCHAKTALGRGMIVQPVQERVGECLRYPPTSHMLIYQIGEVQLTSNFTPVKEDSPACGEYKER